MRNTLAENMRRFNTKNLSKGRLHEQSGFNLTPNLIGIVRVGDNQGVQYVINKVTPFNCGWMEVEIKRGARFTYRYFKPSADVNPAQRTIEFSRFGEGVKAQDPCQQYVDFEQYRESVQFGTKPGEVPNINQ